MAGDWIKMRHDLADDPAVLKLVADTACVDADHVVGKLHRLWCWADRHTKNGHAPGVTAEWVDVFLRTPGFSDIIIFCGWLRVTRTGLVFPKFNRHNSESAKKRALAARRQAAKRSRDSHAAGDTKAPPEERRGEERSSLDRSIDRFDRIDEGAWKNAQAACRGYLKNIQAARPSIERTKPLVEKLAKACVCVELGVLPTEWLVGVVNKLLQPPAKKRPAQWLGKVLAADAAALGCDFDAYQRAITLPNPKGPEES